jgi:hypothetical protein
MLFPNRELGLLLEKLNEALTPVLRNYSIKVCRPGGANAGDFVLFEGAFRQVVATGYEQGSGPRPDRCSLAFVGNDQIVEPDAYSSVIVLTPISS